MKLDTWINWKNFFFPHLEVLNISSRGKIRNFNMPHYCSKLLRANGVKETVMWIFVRGHMQPFIL